MKKYKMIALLKKREDISRDEFISHYEVVHVPLMLSIFPTIREYRRNYADFDSAFLFPDAAPFDFDCVTEFWFDSEADYKDFLKRSADPDVVARVEADAQLILARSFTRMFDVQEHITTNPS